MRATAFTGSASSCWRPSSAARRVRRSGRSRWCSPPNAAIPRTFHAAPRVCDGAWPHRPRPGAAPGACRSSVRISSSRIRPSLRRNRSAMRYGAGWLPVVIGATVTVSKWSCISGGEMITQGRVFWISLPNVGSSAASQISPRTTPAAGRLTTCDRCHRHCRTPAILVRRRPPRRWRATPPPNPSASVVAPAQGSADHPPVACPRRHLPPVRVERDPASV